MVGDHPVRGLGLALGLDPGQLDRRGDQGLEQVDVVVVVHALQHGGDALQAHAGVDGGLGQGQARTAVVELLVLHEHEVPDLDEAVAVLIGRAGRAARDGLAVVVEDLRAGTAGAGVAHGPEVVRGGDADDLVVGQAGDLLPQPVGLVVLGVDGDQQLVLGQTELLGHQVPGQLDRAFLEVVAEGEVAEHLEEGVVARGVTDVVQVVVLAAGAHRLLRGGRARGGRGLGAGEEVLERHHAGVDEQQGRIVLRHQRRGRHHQVPGGLVVVQEGAADVVEALHVVSA